MSYEIYQTLLPNDVPMLAAFYVARRQCDKNLNYDSNKCQCRIFKDVIYFIRAKCACLHTRGDQVSKRKYKMCRLHTPRVYINVTTLEFSLHIDKTLKRARISLFLQIFKYMLLNSLLQHMLFIPITE